MRMGGGGGGGWLSHVSGASIFLPLPHPLLLSPDSLGLSHAHIDSLSESPPASRPPSHLCPPYLRFAFSAHL